MAKILMLVVAFALAGCTSLDAVVDRGAGINDAGVQGSIDGLCRVYSVGAIKRYFDTPEKAALYQDLCKEQSAWSPVVAPMVDQLREGGSW